MWSPIAKVYNPLKAGSIDGTDTEPHDRGIIRALNVTYIPNRDIKGKPECTIFVARLDRKTSEETLRHIFSAHGRVLKCTVVRDIVTGASRGYAFIEYDRESSAIEAYNRSFQRIIEDRKVLVDYECERLLPGWIPRRLGGGFGGKKESGQLRFGRRDRPFRRPIVPMINRPVDSFPKEKRDDDTHRETRDDDIRREKRDDMRRKKRDDDMRREKRDDDRPMRREKRGEDEHREKREDDRPTRREKRDDDDIHRTHSNKPHRPSDRHL